MEQSRVLTRLITNSNYVFILGSKDLDTRKIRIDSLTANSIPLNPVGTGYQDINGDNLFDLVLRFQSIPANASVEITGSLFDGTLFTAKSNIHPSEMNPQTPALAVKQPFPQKRRGGCCYKRM